MTKEKALEKLHILLEDLDKLPKYIDYNKDSMLTKFKLKTNRYLKEIFIHRTNSFAFEDIEFESIVPFHTEQSNLIKIYEKAIENTKALFEAFIEEVEEWKDNITESVIPTQNSQISITTSNKVFIVHGHDELAISQVSELLRKLNLEPIVLRDQVSRSDTVIEKIENYTSKVGFGVILYTECDIGGKTIDSLQSRARQNVVLEHGYLMAKLGRENTMALVKGSVETPGDISGLVYTLMDEHKAWQYKLVDELRASGYNVSKDNI